MNMSQQHIKDEMEQIKAIVDASQQYLETRMDMSQQHIKDENESTLCKYSTIIEKELEGVKEVVEIVKRK